MGLPLVCDTAEAELWLVLWLLICDPPGRPERWWTPCSRRSVPERKNHQAEKTPNNLGEMLLSLQLWTQEKMNYFNKCKLYDNIYNRTDFRRKFRFYEKRKQWNRLLSLLSYYYRLGFDYFPNTDNFQFDDIMWVKWRLGSSPGHQVLGHQRFRMSL